MQQRLQPHLHQAAQSETAHALVVFEVRERRFAGVAALRTKLHATRAGQVLKGCAPIYIEVPIKLDTPVSGPFYTFAPERTTGAGFAFVDFYFKFEPRYILAATEFLEDEFAAR